MAAPTYDMRGLADLQRDLRRMSPAMARGITSVMRMEIAKPVGMLARQYASDFSPSGAKTIKWSAARSSATIYTDLYWMKFWEAEGGFRPGGGSTVIQGPRALHTARDDKADDTVEKLDDLLALVARKVGGFN